MRLLNVRSLKFRQFHDRSVPKYVVASHRWVTGEGDENLEATFLDVKEKQNKDTKGYKKVLDFAKYVEKHVDGVEWLWIDTCCINKQDAQEVTESINLMFRWYRDAAVCLAYLADVKTTGELESSEWFKRGWTLQELVAPRVVVFLSQDWQVLGHKSSDSNEDLAVSLQVGLVLDATLANITNVSEAVLRDYDQAKSLTVQDKFAWLKGRKTTKEEDMSYCMIGIFDAPIVANYGEGGDRARKRLRAEISKDDAVLDRLPIARGAAFDDMENELVSECLPETRIGILQDIDSWATGEDGARIFWLAGMAGTGKSTIFKTISMTFKDKSCLAATFCFKKGEADRGNALRLMTTICAQLARRVPEVRQSVISVLEQDPDVVRKSLREQFQRLIFQPLQLIKPLPRHAPTWIVGIDALDECDNDAEISIVLDLLAKLESLESASVRIFVTSRPELPLRLGFACMSSDMHVDVRLEEITRDHIAHDITIYLRHKLAEIRSAWRELNGSSALHPDWPGESAVQDLVKMAHPLFIFAATTCRLLAEFDEDPEESLRTILKHRLEPSQLDRTYQPVLDRLLLNKTNRQWDAVVSDFRLVVGAILLLSEPLPVPALSRLLEVPETKIVARLNRLHSVLDVPSAGDSSRAVRPLHLSFRDYLTHPGTPMKTPFWIDEAQTHRNLARQCLRLLSNCRSIREDVCMVKEPGTRRLDISTAQVAERIPVDVAYACSYWVLHTVNGGESLYDNDQVDQFLHMHFLQWLEALSWLGRISWVVAFIGDLKSRVKVGDSDTLLAFLEDARRFVLRNRHVIDLAPLQTYTSALLFTPTNSCVRRQFECNIPAWITVRPQVAADWGAEVQKLEGHGRPVTCMAYSPNGQTIASGSLDGTLRIWNAVTGAEIHSLVGHSHWINSVAYSPDGQQVASGSSDYDVRIWNVVTGVGIHILEGHKDAVSSVAYSPNGHSIASGSYDGTVRIWNTGEGIEIHQLEGGRGRVNSVVFSPGGYVIASGSHNGTVRLWSVVTGLELRRVIPGCGGAVYAVAFSPNGRIIASASEYGEVCLLDAMTFIPTHEPQVHVSGVAVDGLAFWRDGRTLVSTNDGMIQYWDLETGEKQHTKYAGINAVALAPDGQNMALGLQDDNTILICKASACEQTRSPADRNARIDSISFSEDGETVWAVSRNIIRTWNVAKAEEMPKLVGHKDRVMSTALSPDKRLLASISSDGTARLWDLKTGEQLHELLYPSDAPTAMTFSPDAWLVAVGSAHGAIQLRWTSTSNSTSTLGDHEQHVQALSFSADGTTHIWSPMNNTIDFPAGVGLRGPESHDLPKWPRLEFLGFDQSVVHLNATFAIYWDPWFLGIYYGDRMNVPGIFNGTDTVSYDLRPYVTSRQTRGRLPTSPLALVDAWIQFCGRDVLWLPQDHRGRISGTVWAAHQDKIVIGQDAGAVSFFQIQGRDENEGKGRQDEMAV